MARSNAGFKGVPCIKCGAEDGVRVNICDMTFACRECDEEYRSDDVRELIEKWTKVLEWVKAAEAF